MANASGADPPPSLQQMVEAVTAAALAAVERHLAHMGLYPAPVAPPPSPAGPVAPTTHPAVVPTDTVSPFVNPASVAPPPPPAGPVAPTTHTTAVPTNNACPLVTPASTATPPPLKGSSRYPRGVSYVSTVRKRLSMVHRYLVLRWGVDIVFGDPRGIPFSVRKGGHLSRCPRGINVSIEGGRRASMSPRYPFFPWEWGIVS